MTPEFIIAQHSAFGVSNGYSEPHKLGPDRWAALIAAHHAQLGATCIVDCGTALTIDVLTADGKHLGGLIMPGLNLMRSALFFHTHALPCKMNLETETDIASLARDTQAGIRSGTLYAVVATIERVIADIASDRKLRTRVITGGDAEHIAPRLAGHYRHEPDLVLQGLAIIAGDDQ